MVYREEGIGGVMVFVVVLQLVVGFIDVVVFIVTGTEYVIVVVLQLVEGRGGGI